MKTFLYEVGGGIGNNIHATHIINFLTRLHPSWKIIVRTKHPDLWVKKPNVEIYSDKEERIFKVDFRANNMFKDLLMAPIEVNEQTLRNPPFLDGVHETDLNAQPIEEWSGFKISPDLREINIDDKVPYLFPTGAKPPTIGLCNGGTNNENWRRKRWVYYEELAAQLRGNSFNTVSIYLDPEDRINNCEFYLQIPELPKLAYQLTGLDLLITNDCGVMHIADVLGVAIIAIFGMTLQDKNGPLNPRAQIVSMDFDCQPCQRTLLRTTCPEVKCMEQLKPEKVFDKVQSIFSR